MTTTPLGAGSTPGAATSADDVREIPLVLLRLEAVDRARLEELVTDAWRMRSGAD